MSQFAEMMLDDVANIDDLQMSDIMSVMRGWESRDLNFCLNNLNRLTDAVKNELKSRTPK
jgi:hypothetical protein